VKNIFLTLCFSFIVSICFGADITITTQAQLNNYLGGLTNNTIPAEDSVIINGPPSLDFNMNITLINKGVINIIFGSEFSNNFILINDGTIRITNASPSINNNAQIINNGRFILDNPGVDMNDGARFINNGQFSSINVNDGNLNLELYDNAVFENYGLVNLSFSEDEVILNAESLFLNCGTFLFGSDLTVAVEDDATFISNVPLEIIDFEGTPIVVDPSRCPTIPALSQWGLICLSILLLITGCIVVGQVRFMPKQI
jgi:hypothetical protein